TDANAVRGHEPTVPKGVHRSGLCSVPSNVRTGPTDANAVRGHEPTVPKGVHRSGLCSVPPYVRTGPTVADAFLPCSRANRPKGVHLSRNVLTRTSVYVARKLRLCGGATFLSPNPTPPPPPFLVRRKPFSSDSEHKKREGTIY
ncbi:unnamed protein product, partial [Ectocarpus fasciculatus]